MGIIEVVGGLMFLGWLMHSHHDEHHHHKVACDVDETRRRRSTARCDDETLSPWHIRHRVEEIFAHVEEARCHRAPAIAGALTTPHGRSCLGRSLPRGGRHAEERALEQVEIAVVDDRPGDIDDAIYVLIHGEELDCHDHFTEAWRLVRGRHRDWLLDDIFVGEQVNQAIREARANAQRTTGSNVVMKKSGGR